MVQNALVHMLQRYTMNVSAFQDGFSPDRWPRPGQITVRVTVASIKDKMNASPLILTFPMTKRHVPLLLKIVCCQPRVPLGVFKFVFAFFLKILEESKRKSDVSRVFTHDIHIITSKRRSSLSVVNIRTPA